MNIKIIAVPLLILVIMVFSIWYVYPEYQDIKNISPITAEEKAKLADFDKKNAAISNLAIQAKSASQEQDTLAEYIPSQKKEEDIINQLNDISFTNGLLVLEITFEESKDAKIATTDFAGNPLTTDPTTGEVAPIDPITGAAIVSAAPKPKDVNVRMVGMGSYEQIKAFLRKLEKLKRYNGIKLIKISRDLDRTGGQASDNETSTNLLKMEVTINFNYLLEVKKINSVDNDILKIQELDPSIAEKISKEKNSEIPAINITSIGESNPFFKQ
jgi:Tfp pilus assembly protein PilO